MLRSGEKIQKPYLQRIWKRFSTVLILGLTLPKAAREKNRVYTVKKRGNFMFLIEI